MDRRTARAKRRSEDRAASRFTPSLILRPQDRLPVGTRVVMFGDHPWAGHSGIIDRHEVIALFRAEGAKPVIKLDNGMECFGMDPRQYRTVK